MDTWTKSRGINPCLLILSHAQMATKPNKSQVPESCTRLGLPAPSRFRRTSVTLENKGTLFWGRPPHSGEANQKKKDNNWCHCTTESRNNFKYHPSTNSNPPNPPPGPRLVLRGQISLGVLPKCHVCRPCSQRQRFLFEGKQGEGSVKP